MTKLKARDPFERTIFTDEQDMAYLKDETIFSETFNSRKRAVDELARRYKQRAIPIIREVIDASSTLTTRDNDVFRRYCQMLLEELAESSKSNTC